MNGSSRLPLGSDTPVRSFAEMRVALIGVSAAGVALIEPPMDGRLVAMLLCVAMPFSVGVLILARRSPERAMSFGVAIGDFVVLAAIEAVAPASYAIVRFAALSFVAVHAHFQGAARGVALAALGAGLLTAVTGLRWSPIPDRLFLFYDLVFLASAIGTAWLVGRLRTSESALRLRARGLTLRALEDEREVRRRIAEVLHDGPIQDLIALDMILAAAAAADERGDRDRSRVLLAEARALAVRNVEAMREEIREMGPDGFQELSLDVALENARLAWERRYDVAVRLNLKPVTLEVEAAGDLFRIAQEAVVNAGRHAGAATVAVSLREHDDEVVLSVADDGSGFGLTDPPAQANKTGHLGLTSMRGRALLLGATLDIESGKGGTTVRVRAPRRPTALA